MADINKDLVRSALAGGVLTLTIDRPEVHNALNHAVLEALLRHFRAAACDPAVRVVVLAAEGPNFSAGVDLAHMAQLNKMPRQESVADGLMIAETLTALRCLPQPTVAAVQGPVFGGGLALVVACDLVLAAEAARFSAAETRLGLTPVLLTPYLVARVGQSAARRLLLTCEKIDADEAFRIGLADQIASGDALKPALDELTAKLLKSSPGALAATKRILAQGAPLPLAPGAMRDAAEAIATARAGAEAADGIASFLAKVKPQWARP